MTQEPAPKKHLFLQGIVLNLIHAGAGTYYVCPSSVAYPSTGDNVEIHCMNPQVCGEIGDNCWKLPGSPKQGPKIGSKVA